MEPLRALQVHDQQAAVSSEEQQRDERAGRRSAVASPRRARRPRRRAAAPAATDLVHRYAATRQPQGRGSCDTSYTVRPSASTAFGVAPRRPRPAAIRRRGRPASTGSLARCPTWSRSARAGARARASRGRPRRRRASGASPAPASGPRPARARHARDLALGVVEVPGEDRPLGADDDARGLEPPLHPVGAEVALGGGVRVGVDVERVVGARLHARLAADAAVAVEVDDAVRPPVERHRRADRHAGRVVAVVAAHDREVPARVRELALLDVLHPRAERRRAGRGSPPCTPPCRRGSRCTASGR